MDINWLNLFLLFFAVCLLWCASLSLEDARIALHVFGVALAVVTVQQSSSTLEKENKRAAFEVVRKESILVEYEEKTKTKKDDPIAAKALELGHDIVLSRVVDAPQIERRIYRLQTGIVRPVLAAAQDYAVALRKSVNVSLENGDIYFDVPKDKRTYVEFPPPRNKKSVIEPLPLGIAVDGSTVFWDCTVDYHLLVGGMTGSGKSEFMEVVYENLVRGYHPHAYECVRIDGKGNTFVGDDVCYDQDSVNQAVLNLNAVLNSRTEEFRQKGIKNIRDTDQQHWFVLWDECIEHYPRIREEVDRLARMGGALGIHLVMATQKPLINNKTGLSSELRSNLSGRVCLKVTDGATSKVVTDALGGENLLGKGDALVIMGGECKRTQIYKVN